MAYDEGLAERIRESLGPREGLTEKKMFGGIAFMLNGKMICGIVKDDLMVRVGPDGHDAALEKPGARPMDFAGRPMRGMVYVEPAAIKQDETLGAWLDGAIAFANSLPAKKPAAKKAAKQSAAASRARGR